MQSVLTPLWRLRTRRVDAERRVDQRGETLLEVLLTIFIMSTVLLSLLGLLMTVVVASSAHRATVSAGNQATTAAEAVDRAAYTTCGPSNDPLAAYNGLVTGLAEPGYVAEVSSVRFLSSRTTANPTYVSACPGGGNDQGTQLVTIRVRRTAPPSSSATVELVKRNQTCPAGMAGQIAPGQLC